MKKIVFIMPHVTGRGGTENVMGIVMQTLQRTDISPKLYLFGGSENKEWLKGINYSETQFSPSKWIRMFQNILFIFILIARFLKREKPDMVIATHSITCFVVYWIRKLTKGKYPIVSWIHFSLTAKNVKPFFLRYADFHLAICESIRKQFTQIGIQDSRVLVVNNPVLKTERIIPRPKSEKVFLYVGRIEFEGQKRIKDLFDVLSKVNGKWKLQVFGDGFDLERCKLYAEKKHLSPNISWMGWNSNPWSAIKSATALVMTSSYEGFGMVLAEAISNGVYCISSDCKVGPSDIIINGKNGSLYELGDLERLQSLLQSFVDGKELPNQNEIKDSINRFYLDNYLLNFKYSLEKINSEWKS